ncbi:hypothetical protein H312_02517 [Anncaliia algerae PRA339]|uniref:HTH psq-type domain-containing protein n=1 Tax=Anncaliia algerae PRA339 TaxID=1288291 RepID=A0A059EZ27_9MICR|nr:hypothetical protein H312_02517 [Anncaliia algerae PRA339]
MSKQLSKYVRCQIVAYLELGFTTREAAEHFRVNQSTVVRINTKWKKFATFEHLCGNGRPSKATSDVTSLILLKNIKISREPLEKLHPRYIMGHIIY